MKGREEGSREQEDGGWLERSSEETRAEERTEAQALNTVLEATLELSINQEIREQFRSQGKEVRATSLSQSSSPYSFAS